VVAKKPLAHVIKEAIYFTYHFEGGVATPPFYFTSLKQFNMNSKTTFSAILFLALIFSGNTILTQVAYPVTDECQTPLLFGDNTELLGVLGERLIFFNALNSNHSLWGSDPATNVTAVIKETTATSNLSLQVNTDTAWFFKEIRNDRHLISILTLDSDTLLPRYTAPDDAVIGAVVHWNNALYFEQKLQFDDEKLVRFDLQTEELTVLFTSDFGGIRGLSTLNDYVICIANTDAGKMLVRSDGTIAGTNIVSQLYDSGSEFATSPRMYSNGELLYFFYHPNNSPYNLWVTDGTAEGTSLLNGYSTANVPPRNGAFLGDKFIFIAKNPGTPSGFTLELHSSDGTPEGTFGLNEASGYLHPRLLTPFGGRIYFSAIIAGDWGIYSTDGTAGSITTELPPYGSIRNLFQLGVFRDSLVFSGTDSSFDFGSEPYISDGTPEGSRRIGDLVTGEGSSSPSYFTSSANHLFFLISKNGNQRELWVYNPDLSTSPNVPVSLVDSVIIDAEEGSTGEASFSASGGLPPYTYTLDNGTTNSTGLFPDLPGGDYTLTITDGNNCALSVAFSIDIVISTSTLHEIVNHLAVYPIPSNGETITIDLQTKEYLESPTLEIWSLQGTIKQTQELQSANSWTTQVDLKGLPSGSYLLILRAHGELIAKRVVIKS
jgi:ELWxxDGT repeat protein